MHYSSVCRGCQNCVRRAFLARWLEDFSTVAGAPQTSCNLAARTHLLSSRLCPTFSCNISATCRRNCHWYALISPRRSRADVYFPSPKSERHGSSMPGGTRRERVVRQSTDLYVPIDLRVPSHVRRHADTIFKRTSRERTSHEVPNRQVPALQQAF